MSDYVHFAIRKASITLKLPKEVGPCLVKTRLALDKAEKRLADLKFEQAGPWMYDSHNVIYNKRTD